MSDKDTSENKRTSAETLGAPPPNLLLSAAAPILSLSQHLRSKQLGSSVDALQSQLVALIHKFMQEGQREHYPAAMLIAARYLLCATLDDLIREASWIEENAWDSKTLTHYFNQESDPAHRFYLILQQACEDPEANIDLIELGYHCLSMGYMGEYKHTENGDETIAKLMDGIFHLINATRGDAPTQLFFSTKPLPALEAKPPEPSKRSRLPIVIWCIATVTFIIMLLPYQQKLAELAKPIQQKINSLTQPVTRTAHDA